MPLKNLQDANVGNLGDILKHAALVQLAKLFTEEITSSEKYYLDSHSYLYQSRLAAENWLEQSHHLLQTSRFYQDYIDIEMPFVEKGEYLCSSGLINRVLPGAHLLLCETNRETREWLLQQLADNRVTYYTVKEQMYKWVKGKKFKQLPNLLALIDPFELNDELWQSANQCLRGMVSNGAPVLILVFDYKKSPLREWPDATDNWLQRVASISCQPYHLAVYSSERFIRPARECLKELGWELSL